MDSIVYYPILIVLWGAFLSVPVLFGVWALTYALDYITEEDQWGEVLFQNLKQHFNLFDMCFSYLYRDVEENGGIFLAFWAALFLVFHMICGIAFAKQEKEFRDTINCYFEFLNWAFTGIADFLAAYLGTFVGAAAIVCVVLVLAKYLYKGRKIVKAMEANLDEESKDD